MKEKIKLGMDLLDEKVPGWRDRIDLKNLNMGSCESCILGQLFNDFGLGLKKLDIDLYDTTIFELAFEKSSGESYTQLTKNWKQALSEERTQ